MENNDLKTKREAAAEEIRKLNIALLKRNTRSIDNPHENGNTKSIPRYLSETVIEDIKNR